MKKILAMLLALTMVFALCACGQAAAPAAPAAPAAGEAAPAADAGVPDEMTAADGKYPVAMVTDVGQLKDGSFNEGIWNGTKNYAYENNIAYKYYQPANGNEATDDDRYDAMKAAADGGAEIVMCAGFMASAAIAKAAEAYPEVKWVYIDGGVSIGSDGNPLKNTMGIAFTEEACGYFAGYGVVKDGFTKLGFAGGGGGTTPACCRFGYGWVQGANAAAAELGVEVEMNYSWLYGASFSNSPELEAMLNGWYENGTEVIFPCGGSMCLSAFSAASANDAWTIGVDSDQAAQSDTVLTSAMKGVDTAAYWILGEYYAGNWDNYGGGSATLGVKDGAILLPTAESSWRFQKFTVEEYEKMFEAAQSGTLVIDDKYPEADGKTMADLEFSNVKVTVVE